MTPAEGADFLGAAVAESFSLAKGQFRELCVGIECAIAELCDRGLAIDELTLGFYKDGLRVEDVCFLARVPADYQCEGIWAAIYSCLTPRHTPFGKDPLRVRELAIGYRLAPQITYDPEQDNGLPMAFDRPYRPEVLTK